MKISFNWFFNYALGTTNYGWVAQMVRAQLGVPRLPLMMQVQSLPQPYNYENGNFFGFESVVIVPI